jgi:hypothetical protein
VFKSIQHRTSESYNPKQNRADDFYFEEIDSNIGADGTNNDEIAVYVEEIEETSGRKERNSREMDSYNREININIDAKRLNI